MMDQLWPFLKSAEGATLLSLWGAASGAHSMVSGIRSSADMRRLVEDMRQLNLKVDQISARVYIAPESRVVTDKAAPNAPSAIAPTSKEGRLVATESEALTGMLHASILSSSVIWTPEKFEKDFKRVPGDVLINVQMLGPEVKVPVEADLIPVTFHEGAILRVGWQKRRVLESVFGICVDELKWQSPAATGSPPAAYEHKGTRYVGKGNLAAQCADCRTSFKVSPVQLAAAQGWVRCGACQKVFCAADSLFDIAREPPPFGKKK